MSDLNKNLSSILVNNNYFSLLLLIILTIILFFTGIIIKDISDSSIKAQSYHQKEIEIIAEKFKVELEKTKLNQTTADVIQNKINQDIIRFNDEINKKTEELVNDFDNRSEKIQNAVDLLRIQIEVDKSKLIQKFGDSKNEYPSERTYELIQLMEQVLAENTLSKYKEIKESIKNNETTNYGYNTYAAPYSTGAYYDYSSGDVSKILEEVTKNPLTSITNQLINNGSLWGIYISLSSIFLFIFIITGLQILKIEKKSTLSNDNNSDE